MNWKLFLLQYSVLPKFFRYLCRLLYNILFTTIKYPIYLIYIDIDIDIDIKNQSCCKRFVNFLKVCINTINSVDS